MRITLEKRLEGMSSIANEVEMINLGGDELRKFLLNTLPTVMEGIIDPDIDDTKPERYIKNLFDNKLGDFNKRHIITIGKDEVKALLVGIRKDDYFHILTVGVVKDYRGNNYGEEIINSCLNTMFSESYMYAKLNVHSSNYPAMQLYSKLGFNPEAS